MTTKLYKREDRYDLYSEDDHKIASSAPNTFGKLSKQNCDEIFGVIDVIDVTYKQVRKEFDGIIDSFTEAFAKQCINKAVELNKDKVFTLEDVKKAYIQGKHGGKTQAYVEFDDYIQSLQQPTEIEVEIEMEKVVDETKIVGSVKEVKGSGDKITTYKTIPKLDSEECLILTKKI
jgi:hypothetical protein